MRTFRADLHIHSCMSPCSELDMTPSAIVRTAVEAGLDIIAIADHNSSEHIGVTTAIARDSGLTVIPAMEISTMEEAHILALFGDLDSCLAVQGRIYDHLQMVPGYTHDETSQPVVNEKNEILYFNPRPLINATDLPASAVVDLIHNKDGLAIASHIDRETFSIVSQLGFIPDSVSFDAVELSWRIRSEEQASAILPSPDLTAVSFSDAHHVQDIGRRTTEFNIEIPSLEEIALAIKAQSGRSVQIRF